MECSEFQKNIQPFIEGKQTMSKKEEMVRHLLSCKECSDELEIYYTIINCVKELDGKSETSDDYHGEYHNFIERTKKEIYRYKSKSLRHRIAFNGIVGAAVILTGVSVKTESEVKVEEVREEKEFTENDLSMRFRFSDSKILSDSFSDIEALSEEIGIRRELYGR